MEQEQSGGTASKDDDVVGDEVEEEGVSASVVSDSATKGAVGEEESLETCVELGLQEQPHGDGEIGAVEAIDKELAVSTDCMEGQEHTSAKSPSMEMRNDQQPSKDVLSTNGNINMEQKTDEDLDVPADCTQDQEQVSSTSPCIEMECKQKPHKYVLSTSEDPFHSLHSTDNTPPTSPGGVSSCSTLVDPSSRKVSPSDAKMGGETSPITAVKDFAYSCLDSNHMRDPVAIVDDNTELELAWQLKKVTAGEKVVARKPKKQKARDQNQGEGLEGADEKSLSGQVETNTFDAEISESKSCIECVNDKLEPVPSHEQHGMEIEQIQSAVETTLDQQTGDPLQNRVGSAAYIDSAHRLAFRENNSDVQDQGFIQPKDQLPTSENSESKQPASIPVNMHDQRNEVESPAEVIGGPQPDNKAEESQGGPMEEVVAESSNPATKQPVAEKDGKADLHTLRDSNEAGERLDTNTGPWKNEEAEEVNNSEPQSEEVQATEATKDEQVGGASSPSEKVQAEANTEQIKSQEPGEGDPEEMADPMDDSIATTFEDAAPEKEDLNESSGEDQVFYSDGDSPSTLDHDASDYNRDQGSATQDPFSDGDSSGLSEYSTEALGLAALWGILHTGQHDSGTEDGADASEDTELSGPATLWGILQSDRQKNLVEEQEVSRDSPNPPKADADKNHEHDRADPVLSQDRVASTDDIPPSGSAKGVEGHNTNTTNAPELEPPNKAEEYEACTVFARASYGDGLSKSDDYDANVGADLTQGANPQELNHPEKSEAGAVQAPTVSKYQPTCEEVPEDFTTPSAQDICTLIGRAEVPPSHALSKVPKSSPSTIPPPQAKTLNDIYLMSRPSKLTKTQKRNLERRRATAKKRAIAKSVETAEAQGPMEEAATPVQGSVK